MVRKRYTEEQIIAVLNESEAGARTADRRSKLSVQSGGVVFTTIQKFFPEERSDTHPTLSDRRNIVVIADEAHHSQYDFVDGFASHMRDALPRASFVGFTGTPIELQDANTRAVFGDYISIYDIQRSVEDGATVRIYYESRLAKLALDEDEKPTIDPEFEEATEGEEVERREKLKTKWAQLEAIVGSENRLKQVAQELSTSLSSVEGVVNLESDVAQARDEVAIRVDSAAAANIGLTARQVGVPAKRIPSGEGSDNHRHRWSGYRRGPIRPEGCFGKHRPDQRTADRGTGRRSATTPASPGGDSRRVGDYHPHRWAAVRQHHCRHHR